VDRWSHGEHKVIGGHITEPRSKELNVKKKSDADVKEGEIDEARGGRDEDVGEKEGGTKREGKEARTGRVLKQGQRRS
jgi:hypothetical protein